MIWYKSGRADRRHSPLPNHNVVWWTLEQFGSCVSCNLCRTLISDKWYFIAWADLVLQPCFTSSIHITTTLFFLDLIYIYATTTHHIPLASRFIRDVKDNSLSTTKIHCVFGLCFTFLCSLITYTQTFYFLHYVPPTQWVEPLRASRTTPGIDSKWLGHPHFALSEAVHISLYVFA
jgi:hypothetical protein